MYIRSPSEQLYLEKLNDLLPIFHSGLGTKISKRCEQTLRKINQNIVINICGRKIGLTEM